jgi:hypothetical protein
MPNDKGDRGEPEAKRTREACLSTFGSYITTRSTDNSHRRKKTRCPGGRPACEYCVRLGQTCEYASDSATSTNTDRIRRASSNAAPVSPPGSTIAAPQQTRGPSGPSTVRMSIA